MSEYKKITLLKTLVTTTALLGAASAQAAVIGFEETLPTFFGLSSYQEDGFTLTSNVPDGTIIDVNNDVRGNLGIFGGGTDSQTMVWGANGSTSTINMTNDASSPFWAYSLDASSMMNATGELLLTGTLHGGGTVTQTINLNSALSTYNLVGMNELSSLDISFDGNAYFAPFDLDNISVSIVPIPAAVWLFGSGIAMLFVFRRRTS